MQPQVKTDFNVTVYPSGRGWGEENPARIYFPDKETKDAFVEAEAKFCAVQRAEFNGAMNSAEREEKRKEFLARRAFFAMNQGYAPAIKDPKQWYYNPPRDNMTV